MLDFSSGQLDALANRHVMRRFFIWCEARDPISGDPDPVGFWDDVGDVEHGGRTYHGSGTIAKIDTISAQSDFAIAGLTITLSGISNAVISLVRGEVVSQAPITVLIGIFDVDTRQLIDNLIPMFVGVIDRVEINTPPSGGTSEIIFSCESIARALTIKRTATRSEPTHKERAPSDMFFNYTGAQRERSIYFGRRDPNAGKANAKGGAGTT